MSTERRVKPLMAGARRLEKQEAKYLTRLEIIKEMKDIDRRLNKVRGSATKELGGVTYQKDFGIYTMNIPSNEAFFNYIEKDIASAQKLLQCFFDSVEN